MFVRFQIFVSVMCLLYQHAECIKQKKDDAKINMNLKMSSIEQRGGRSVRSLLNLKNEDASVHVKRVAEYFETGGPMREVKLREPCELVKCDQCSSNLCKSRESNNPPSVEPKDNIVGATMENSWCPAEMLGIKNNHTPKNEIVGSPRQSLNSNICPKQVITQPNIKERKNFKEPTLNVETTLPITYYKIDQPLQLNPRSFPINNQDLFHQPLGMRQIALPTQEIGLTTSPQLSIPQERTLFNINYPQSSFTMPIKPQLFSTRPLLDHYKKPLLGLFTPKLPFNLFHKKSTPCPSQIFIEVPQRLAIDNLDSSPTPELNQLAKLATPQQFNVVTPQTGINYLTNDLNSQMNYPQSHMNFDTPIILPRKKLIPSLNMGLNPYNFDLVSPLKDLTSYSIDVTAPPLQLPWLYQ